MSTHDVGCTEHVLTLRRPLDELPTPVRMAVTRWLWQHDITPTAIAFDLGVERDDAAGVLMWRERRPDGSVTKRWRLAAPTQDGTGRWPAPFPTALMGTGACRRRRAERADRAERTASARH